MQLNLGKPGCLLVAAVLIGTGSVQALELPAKPLENLASEEFQVREAAQAELLAWARKHPRSATNEIFVHAETEKEPEVRERCLAVLRELVSDEYYQTGEGFIGIRMETVIRLIPGDDVPRAVIRVAEIVPKSPAEDSELQVHDLIMSFGKEIWRGPDAHEKLAKAVASVKPGTEVALEVLRGEKVLRIPVKLGRRLPEMANPFFGNRQNDWETAEKVAKEAYFQDWLTRKRKGD